MIIIQAIDSPSDEVTQITVEAGLEHVVRALILRALVEADFEVKVQDEDGDMITYEEYQG